MNSLKILCLCYVYFLYLAARVVQVGREIDSRQEIFQFTMCGAMQSQGQASSKGWTVCARVTRKRQDLASYIFFVCFQDFIHIETGGGEISH